MIRTRNINLIRIRIIYIRTLNYIYTLYIYNMLWRVINAYYSSLKKNSHFLSQYVYSRENQMFLKARFSPGQSRFIQSILAIGSRRKLNAKKTLAHDDVTHGAMAHKIFIKINDVATRIKLTLSILTPRPWNLLRNSTIHFHICSYSTTHLLRVTGSTLWRSHCHNISSLLTN